MRQVEEFSDIRNKGFCVHCGGPYETDDHMPSKVFLDEPYPENLAVSPSCEQCNNGFSKDEEYLACVLECIVCGSTDPNRLKRTKIARSLEKSPKLTAMIEKCRRIEDGRLLWDIDQERVRNVLIKLARGHSSYELAEPQMNPPSDYWCAPLSTLSEIRRKQFESDEIDGPAVWPELGSRMMTRLLVADDGVFEEGWLLIQEERYRFKVTWDSGIRIRIVLREYLACDIAWDY